MRKILSLLTIFVIVSSCSSDDSTELQQNEFPTNIEITTQSAEVGEVITINGNGFLTNETYTVTFAENKIAEIIEINTSYLNVEVPENAVSGSITLTFNNQTETIGTIEINQQISTRIFGYVNYDKIVEINPNDGSEIGTIATLGSEYANNFVFSEQNNEIIFNQNDQTLKANVQTGNISTLNNSVYERLIISNSQNRLFAYIAYDKIIEIDINNGSEIGTIATLGSDYADNFVLSEQNNEIIFNQNDQTKKANIETGLISSLSNSDYENLIISKNENRLFAYIAYDKIIEIDINNGLEIGTTITLGSDYFADFIVNEEMNEIICHDFENTYKINIQNGNIEQISSTYYESFIAENE